MRVAPALESFSPLLWLALFFEKRAFQGSKTTPDFLELLVLINHLLRGWDEICRLDPKLSVYPIFPMAALLIRLPLDFAVIIESEVVIAVQASISEIVMIGN